MTAPHELGLADVLAARQRSNRCGRRQVAVVCSGGNIRPARLAVLRPRDPA